MGRAVVWEEKKVLEMSGGDGNTTVSMHLRPSTVHLKMFKIVNCVM